MVGAGGVRSPSRVVDEFSADYIFDAGGKVVELVKAFEQPAAGNRAGRDHRGRGVSRFGEEDPVFPYRCGAPPLRRGVFCKRGVFLSNRSTKAGTCVEFEVGGARVVGETKFKTLKATPCCVYRPMSLRIH
jgi:hypothetical protein